MLVETSGERYIGRLPRAVVKVLDVKCPGSGEGGNFCADNLGALEKKDQIKFVIADENDYRYACDFMFQHNLRECVEWTPQGDLWCSLDGATKSYCTPESYKGTRSRLFHNLGNGRFEEVAEKAGLGDPTSKSLGVTVLDYNDDGWPDLFVANDTQPNKLYRNLGNGTFKEEGMAAGVAYGEDGVARGAMGADAADYDRAGRPHLLVGNFSNQMLGLYHNEGNGLFVDEAPSSTVGRASLLSLTFGVFFFDYDLDGYPDILAANGHIEDEIGRVQPKVSYKESPLLFRNLGNRRFDNVSSQVGPAFTKAMVARGAAYADFDHDGDLDVLISTNNGPAVLLRNDGGNRNHWLSVRLRGRARIAMGSAPWSASRAPAENSGIWCAAAPVTARKATWLSRSAWAPMRPPA